MTTIDGLQGRSKLVLCVLILTLLSYSCAKKADSNSNFETLDMIEEEIKAEYESRVLLNLNPQDLRARKEDVVSGRRIWTEVFRMSDGSWSRALRIGCVETPDFKDYYGLVDAANDFKESVSEHHEGVWRQDMSVVFVPNGKTGPFEWWSPDVEENYFCLRQRIPSGQGQGVFVALLSADSKVGLLYCTIEDKRE